MDASTTYPKNKNQRIKRDNNNWISIEKGKTYTRKANIRNNCIFQFYIISYS